MKKKKDEKTRVKIEITLFLVLPLVLILGFFCVRYAVRCVGTKATLESFYDALYVSSDLSAASECLAKESRSDFETALTLAYADESFYKTYRDEAAAQFGEDLGVSVRITGIRSITDSGFEGAESCVSVSYAIVFKGSLGEERYSNTLELISIDGQWYMTGYLKLPIGYNLRVE